MSIPSALAKYICCGLPYPDRKALTDHMRADHNVGRFSLVVSCCGTNFKDGGEMRLRRKYHHILAGNRPNISFGSILIVLSAVFLFFGG